MGEPWFGSVLARREQNLQTESNSAHEIDFSCALTIFYALTS